MFCVCICFQDSCSLDISSTIGWMLNHCNQQKKEVFRFWNRSKQGQDQGQMSEIAFCQFEVYFKGSYWHPNEYQEGLDFLMVGLKFYFFVNWSKYLEHVTRLQFYSSVFWLRLLFAAQFPSSALHYKNKNRDREHAACRLHFLQVIW